MSSNGSHETQIARLDSVFSSGGSSRNFTSLLNPSYLQAAGKTAVKREAGTDDKDERRQRRKRSRWGNDEKEKTYIPGMPTVLPTNLSREQEEAYLVQLQIEEISRKLRTGELGIPINPEERCAAIAKTINRVCVEIATASRGQSGLRVFFDIRDGSPSPEPIYSSDGKRLNTREYRTRKNLEEGRHHLIQQMINLNPEFKPPADYKPPIIRVSDKVMIPQEDHPDINFVGLLIGPRGNTLKSMERDTGAKIIIRGKGSVKEGKVGRKDGQPLPGEDEPLHAYVTANNPEAVKKAVDRIKEIIRQGVEVPEGQNDLRRMQLRELALLNGTLRENEGPRCSNCGASDHKSWMCPDKPNVTNNIVCSSCGGAGHISRDCRQKRPGGGGSSGGDKTKIDEEYMSLMAELGEGPPPSHHRNDRDSGSRFGRRSGGGGNSLFDRQMAPRAIMAPPPRLDSVMVTPPQMIPNTLPMPPWNQNNGMQQQKQNDMMPNMNQPPPGQMNNMMPPWQQANVPPPNLLQAPPPPPPAGQQNPTHSIPPLLPWLQSSSHNSQPPPPGSQSPMPPWQQQQPPPGPVPPPMRAPQQMPMQPNMYSWHQGYMGVPPPQPVQPPPPPGQGMDMSGLPSLLAPPPPPPS